MLLEGKKAVIFGLANNKSIAYGIAEAFKKQGARLAFSYVGDAIKKRVEPISEEMGGDFVFPCDVTDDQQIHDAAETVRKNWGNVDILVHSVAFSNREDLLNRFIETSRSGFSLALDVSAYSLVAVCKAFEPMLQPGSSVITLTYYGSQKSIPQYNVMGVAKAALEASVRYLAVDLGKNDVRINAISAGPIRTLAASAVGDFKRRLSQFEEMAPLNRMVTIEDVGGAAVYFGSDLSRAVTGEVSYVDCGFNTKGA